MGVSRQIGVNAGTRVRITSVSLADGQPATKLYNSGPFGMREAAQAWAEVQANSQAYLYAVWFEGGHAVKVLIPSPQARHDAA
jgi:hypothetical protein